MYTGAIVEESLENKEILKDFKILSVIETKEENPADRWHIYEIEVVREQIEIISKNLKSTKWYAHFWNENREVIAIFRDKMFKFNFDDEKSRQPAMEYGLSVGIPKEQLDFVIR